MTATITPIIRRNLPDPTGTSFVHHNGSAFSAREPGWRDLGCNPLSDAIESERPAQRKTNARALNRIALEVLSEPSLTDPNIRYAKAVHLAILEALAAADRISTEDLDELTMALDIAVEYAANAVAAAWLSDRGGSLPIPTTEERL